MGAETDAIRELGYRIVDRIAEEFRDPSRRPVFPPARSLAEMEAAFGGPIPWEGTEPGELLSTVFDRILPAAGNPNHPGSMGYVITSSTPLPALVEALAAAIKLRPTTWKNQPASCHIETTVVRWLGEMVGFSKNAAGYVTTGGSWANLAALAVARVRRAGWDVRAEGLRGHAQLVAYTSEHSHSCLQRSCELLGIGSRSLRKIPVDDRFRIRVDLLERAIESDLASGCRPFCLVGNAGTVETGAVDLLEELADLASRYALWFHVDGAYGAFAALAPSKRPLFPALSRADSLTLDPHKWLNTPFEAGCILFRRWEDLGDTFSLIPAYLQGAMGSEHNQYEYGFELSRADRALKVWLALRQFGVAWYAGMIGGHIELALHLARRIAAEPDFELMIEPELSICCFRYAPSDLKRHGGQERLNALNYAIEMELMADGRALISGTFLNGVRVLRACVAGNSVTRQSVEAMFDLVKEIARCRLH
jgi:glutamate/tyrosine decarboxylase-like PLP-dependent enzyme